MILWCDSEGFISAERILLNAAQFHLVFVLQTEMMYYGSINIGRRHNGEYRSDVIHSTVEWL